MAISKTNRYENLDGLKVIAALGIIAMHVSSNMGHPLSSELISGIIGSMTHFVKLFLVLSSFGMCCGYYEKALSGKLDINKFYIRRYQKNFPFFALLILLDIIANGFNVVWRDVISCLTMTFNFFPSHNLSIIGVGWTLGVIFAFYFLFPFFVFLIANKRRAWISFVISIVLNWCCCNYYVSVGSTDGANILLLACYFFLGGIIYLYRQAIKKKLGNVNMFIQWGILIVVSVLWYVVKCEEFSITFTLKTLALLTVIVAVVISRPLVIFNNRIMHFIGQLGLEIYLSHMLVFRILEKFKISNIFTNSDLNYVMTFGLTVIFTVVFAYVVKSGFGILEKKMMKRAEL